MPQSSNNFIGAPVPGLTNQQAWSQSGLAVAGSVAPCVTTTATMVSAFICPVGTAPPPPPPPPPPTELCGDGIDNDGDGQIDEGCSSPPPPPPPPPPPASSLVANGGFDNGMTGWVQFATPDSSYIVSNITSGVYQFYRVPPQGSTNNQAVLLQETGAAFAAAAPLSASFELGNSSSVRKRLSVVIHDKNFGDLSVCTFWLAPQSPKRVYGMRMHTTQAWTNAVISFYAASTGSNGGFYQVDNVSLVHDPAQDADRTECVDPTVTAAVNQAASANYVFNGNFSSGSVSPWVLHGDIAGQVLGGVFAFYRSGTGTPGVILQQTGQQVSAGKHVTVDLALGNSSNVRKRVTVLIHDADFSDLSACTFWIPPGQGLAPFAIRGFATKAWANATVSVYAVTSGNAAWILLDDVMLRQTPARVTVGTECHEPASLVPGWTPSPAVTPQTSATFVQSPAAVTEANAIFSAVVESPVGDSSWNPSADVWDVVALENATVSLRSEPIDLTHVSNASLSFESWLESAASTAEVQVSTDGVNWISVSAVPPSDSWMPMAVDLSLFAGQVVYVQFTFRAVSSADGAAVDRWRISGVRFGG